MGTGAVRTVLIRSVMGGLLALTGWSVYSAHAATEAAKAAESIHAELAQVMIEVDLLQKELGASVEQRNALMQSVGALSDARAQLSSVQDEIKALEFSREQWHAQIATAQAKLAGLRKQAEPQETGTVLQTVPPARPGRQAGTLSPLMR